MIAILAILSCRREILPILSCQREILLISSIGHRAQREEHYATNDCLLSGLDVWAGRGDIHSSE